MGSLLLVMLGAMVAVEVDGGAGRWDLMVGLVDGGLVVVGLLVGVVVGGWG